MQITQKEILSTVHTYRMENHYQLSTRSLNRLRNVDSRLKKVDSRKSIKPQFRSMSNITKAMAPIDLNSLENAPVKKENFSGQAFVPVENGFSKSHYTTIQPSPPPSIEADYEPQGSPLAEGNSPFDLHDLELERTCHAAPFVNVEDATSLVDSANSDQKRKGWWHDVVARLRRLKRHNLNSDMLI